MKQSLLFAPTLREIPKDAEVLSHKILLKGGYINQTAAGIYTYLPLGYRVIRKIENIIREELNKIGCSELHMPVLNPKDLWVESGRWDKYGKELMRIQDRHEREFCLGPTHEEVVTAIVREHVNSYRKLPLALYQIQTKFRDEFRPRFGLMRGREFIMKDLYTFHANDEDLDLWYLKVREAYVKVLDRLDLDYRIVSADSGNIGGTSSEEFMVLSEIGEDTIVYSDTGTFASNYELTPLEEGQPSPDGVGVIKHAKGIEAGHIFKLGTEYSVAMNAMFLDRDQKQKPLIMGCYGMGISRLLMAILEQHYNNDQANWPKEVTPFNLHILPLEKEDSESFKLAKSLYEKLKTKYEVLFDDRNERPGVKFNDADLIGINHRIVVGKKASSGIFEYKNIREGLDQELNLEQILKLDFK